MELKGFEGTAGWAALRAWHIVSGLGNRCEFGTIDTPE